MVYVAVPTSGQSLGQTRDQIRNNIASLKSSLAVNHIDLDLTGVGKHKFMQMPAQVSAPATLSAEGALYTKTVTSGTQLFYRNESNGTEVQLTGSSSGTDVNLATNGYAFLVGGLLVQWGIKTLSASTGTVTFATSNINFPNAIFNVQCTLISKAGGTSSTNTVAPITGTVLTNKFDFSYTGSSSYVSFYWMAIGY